MVMNIQGTKNWSQIGENQFLSQGLGANKPAKNDRTNSRVQDRAADVGYSGINVSGGDTLLASAVSQRLTPITGNSCLPCQQPMAENNPEYNRHAVNSSAALTARDALNMDARPSSTAVEYQDLTQYTESGRLHSHCEQTTSVKGFPHIMLSSRRPTHEEWGGEQQHTMHSTVQYFGDREGSQEQSDIDAYNTTLLHQYRKQQQCSMQSEPQESYSQDYHQPLLPSVPGYGVYPALLQKQRHYPFKHDSAERLPSLWDRKSNPAESSGNIRPERDMSYLKPPPVDLDDLSDDERERMRVKRERNRVAAAKCRNRRRELLERLEKEAEQLEREQEVLRDNVKKLQAQKRKLGNLLEEHEPNCSNKPEETQTHDHSANSENVTE